MPIFGVFLVGGVGGLGIVVSSFVLSRTSRRKNRLQNTTIAPSYISECKHVTEPFDEIRTEQRILGIFNMRHTLPTSGIAPCKGSVIIHTHSAEVPNTAAKYFPKASPIAYRSLSGESYDAFQLPKSAANEDSASRGYPSETDDFASADECVDDQLAAARAQSHTKEPDELSIAHFEEPEMPELNLSQIGFTTLYRDNSVSFECCYNSHYEAQDHEFQDRVFGDSNVTSPSVAKDGSPGFASAPRYDEYDADSEEGTELSLNMGEIDNLQGEERSSSIPSLTTTATTADKTVPLFADTPDHSISIAPLGRVPRLEESNIQTPIPDLHILMCDENIPLAESPQDSLSPMIPKPILARDCSEETSRAILVEERKAEGHRGEQKENQRANSSLRGASLQHRRISEKGGFFGRRRSQPSLKRFRISERIKIPSLRLRRTNEN